MFSKALFKQSCKANGTMWGIITFAVCFMLACVMLISGNGNIGEVKNSIQDTIVTKEVDAQLQKRALSYYADAENGLEQFDELFAENVSDTLSCLIWYSQMPNQMEFSSSEVYSQTMEMWKSAMPVMTTDAGKAYEDSITQWEQAMPQQSEITADDQLQSWQESSPLTQDAAVTIAYATACEELQESILDSAEKKGYSEDTQQAQEMLGSVMYALNPDGLFDDFYTENGEELPDTYDFMQLIAHVSEGNIDEYTFSEERSNYRRDRAENSAAIFLAGNMTKSDSVDALLEALSEYGVTREKYNSFGYTYDAIKHMASTSIVTYRGRLNYELAELKESYEKGEFESEDKYSEAVNATKTTLADEVSSSFLSTLPSEVSDALEEIGKADLYTLIVGSIFYKLAGLLLPIIYMIMASNNLVAGQVDSGSMAYVLSTSTKRKTVVFTQAVYLIGSLFAMFALTTATGCVCLSIITEEVELTYGKLILLNVGAFLVLLALSGLCFFTSCIFDRSKRSMAIGGGLSIFALVAAMLGLFGSSVIPSVIRLDALNYFNYTTIITLFDVISIIDGTNVFIWKFIILALLGIIGYIAGAAVFKKKDLPL